MGFFWVFGKKKRGSPLKGLGASGSLRDQRKNAGKDGQIMVDEGEKDLDGPEIQEYDVNAEQWQHYLQLSNVRDSGEDELDELPSGTISGQMLQLQTNVVNVSKYISSLAAFDGRSIFLLPVISTYSKFWTVWYYFSMFVDATWTAIMIPIVTAFFPYDNGVKNWPGICNLSVGLFYLLDMIVNMHVTFVVTHNFQKFEVRRGPAIALNYFTRGTMFVDALSVASTIGQIVLLVDNSQKSQTAQQIIMVLRLLRIFRVSRLLGSILFDSIQIEIKGFIGQVIGQTTVYLTTLGYAGFVLANILGCLWYWTAVLQGGIEAQGTWVDSNEIDEDSIAQKWLTSFYFAIVTMSTVGYGDISATTWAEQIFCILAIVAGVLFYGFLLGSITELISNSSQAGQRNAILKERMKDVGQWMACQSFSERTQKAVNKYYRTIWIQQQDTTETQIYNELPQYIRTLITYDTTSDFLKSLPIFQGLGDDLIRGVAGRLSPVYVAKRCQICRQGDEADGIYLLQSGIVDVLSLNMLKTETIRAPDILSELCVFKDDHPGCSERLATYRAMANVNKVWLLSYKDLKPFMKSEPKIYHRLLDIVLQRLRVRLRSLPNDIKQALVDNFEELYDQDKESEFDPIRIKIPGDIYYMIEIIKERTDKMGELWSEIDSQSNVGNDHSIVSKSKFAQSASQSEGTNTNEILLDIQQQ